MTVIVLAKAPVPGRVKTRLCPPCDPEQAAELAEAALVDTLRAVAATPCERRVLVLDGDPARGFPPASRCSPSAATASTSDSRTPSPIPEPAVLLIGMDTPQLTPARLTAALRALGAPGVDAVLGPSVDGGWWALGLRTPEPAVFLGVPMSTPHTGDAQRARLRRASPAHGRAPDHARRRRLR